MQTNHTYDRRLIVAVTAALVVCVPSVRIAAAPRTAEQKQVDAAVSRALKYLAAQQQPNGSWRAGRYGESTATTSLAVMAFLSAGHVPGEGPYGRRLNRAIDWVLAQQQPNGIIVARRSHGPFYSHGISTLMLSEVTGMLAASRSKRCRQVLENAVHLILKAQNVPKSRQHAGGWRYRETDTQSDLSVTGWQLLALRAAKDVGCDVPAESIDRAVAYVRRCRRGRQGFAYMPGGRSSPTLTGVGILSLEVCGKHKSRDVLTGAAALLRRPLRRRDHYFYYGVYYCSVGMFKVGGRYWKKTRASINAILLPSQQTDGSWAATDGGERVAGGIYSTSMTVLALAVEYRYLPIYQR